MRSFTISGSIQTVRGRLLCCLLYLIMCALRPVPETFGQAQAFNASLSGTVTDQSGASVPEASVVLSAPDQGFSRTFVTTEDGRFSFRLLPPGAYTLKVEKVGFRAYVQSGVILIVGQTASQIVVMEPGEVTSVISVTSNAEILNSENANVAADVTQVQARELPLNLRNPFGLVALSSSVNNGVQFQRLNSGGAGGGNADQDISFFNFGGGRFGTTAFLLDGHWLSAGDWAGVMYAPSVDEVQEMKIQTNGFTAQYGWSMGNAVNAITKSGTRDFHGSAFEFLRNDNLDANFFFNNRAGVKKAEFKRNQFGVAAGGPLFVPGLYRQRDKTFVFGLYEGRRFTIPGALITTVPTAAFKAGDFSALLGSPIGTDTLGRNVLAGQLYNPFTTRTLTAGQRDPATGLTASRSGVVRDPVPGNVIPSALIDPVAKNMLRFWPDASNSSLVNNFIGVASTPVVNDQYTVRVDHNISNNSRLFARWSQKRQSQQLVPPYFGEDNPGGPGTEAPNNRWDFGFNYNHVFTPSFIMSATFGWNRWAEGRTSQSVPFNPSTIGLPGFLDGNPSGFPSVNVDGQIGVGGAGITTAGGASLFPREVRTHSVDFTKIRGSHSMNLGFMWLNFRENNFGVARASFSFPVGMTQGPDPTTADPRTGFGFASFLLGTGSSGGQGIAVAPAWQKNLYGWYFQDDWKVSPKLTVNLGIRYEIQMSPTDRFDRLSYFDYSATNPVTSKVGFPVRGQLVFTDPENRGVFQPAYTDLSPRVGFTYGLHDKLIARGGFAIFYVPAVTMDGGRGGLSLNGFSVTTPYVGTLDGITPQNLLRNPFPNGLIPAPGKALAGLTNVGLATNALDRHRPTPYVQQWSLGLQTAISANDSFDVTYVGNRGVKLPYTNIEQNQLATSMLSMGTALLERVPNPFFGAIASSACGLDQPTIPRGQLLRPHPQFCGAANLGAIGASSWYHSAQFTYNRRWHNGLQFLASFTVSKYISQAVGTESWTAPGDALVRDFNNLAAEKALDTNDIPKSLVLSYVYELPFGRGKKFGNALNKPLDGVLGGWQVSGISTFKDGFPLSITALTNNTGSLGGGQRPNLVGDPRVDKPTVDRWLNVQAFAQPPAFTFGNLGRTTTNPRAAGINNFDLTLAKAWSFAESQRLQFRAEFYNAFNHANFYAPNTTFGDSRFGTVTATLPSRSIQFGLKYYW